MSEEIVRLDAGAARKVTERIKLAAGAAADSLDKLGDLISQARDGHAHVALGYPSWTAYVTAEFSGLLPRLAREPRRELVAELAETGMSTRAIAGVVGVHKDTVRNDLAAGGDFSPPAAASPSSADPGPLIDFGDDNGVVEAEIVDETPPPARTAPAAEKVIDAPAPKPVTGLDGKTYTRKPGRAQRRRPLFDEMRDAGVALDKAVARIARIRDDDRFASDSQVASHMRGHLVRAVQDCQALLDRITH